MTTGLDTTLTLSAVLEPQLVALTRLLFCAMISSARGSFILKTSSGSVAESGINTHEHRAVRRSGVTVMVLSYALESRHPGFVLSFAIACGAAAIYAVLIRSWPFAGVEAIWSVIALRRWIVRRSVARGA